MDDRIADAGIDVPGIHSEDEALKYWYDNSLFSKWKKPLKPFSLDNDLIRGDVAHYEASALSMFCPLLVFSEIITKNFMAILM